MADLELRLDRLDALPAAISRTAARDVRSVFPESALISLPGRRPEPLFVSVLIHGDETVGWEALKKLQAWLAHHAPPRALLIFIGNVRAAEARARMLPGRPDYNRIWKGGETPENRLAAAVIDAVQAARPFAAVDLHNNTGANPLYALVHEPRPEDLQLASLFSPRALFTRSPPATLGEAMAQFCPAITAECGQPGVAANEQAAFELILDAMHLDRWRGAADQDMALLDVAGRIEIAEDAGIAFSADAPGEIELPAALEKWNFFERPAGSVFARVRNGARPVRVLDQSGRDVTDLCFRRDGDRLRLTRDFTPVMLTTNETAIRADCLGYLTEKRPLETTAAS